MSNWVYVAPAEDFSPGKQRVVLVDGVRIAVFNLAGRY
jgi:nitrite reductase/ring-hydroxylating ferredoxin subunit